MTQTSFKVRFIASFKKGEICEVCLYLKVLIEGYININKRS